MTGSKLINILKTFTAEEMKMFGKFLASPYHISGKNSTPLFKQLEKIYPDFDTDKLIKENLYKKLYPGKKYNKQVMWNLTSALEKAAKDFLGHEAFRKNKFARMELTLSEFGSRKLLNNYSQTLGEMEKQLESNGIDYDFFDKKGHLENYKQEYYFLTDKVQFKGDSTLKASEFVALYFLRLTVGGLRDLKILEEYHNYKTNLNIPLEFVKNLNLENIVDYANRNNFEFAFMIEIYYHSLKMLLDPQQTVHLERIRELYVLHYKKFSISEQSDLMHWIINYCLYNLDLGKEKHRRIVFELNEFRLKEGLAFYPENQLSKAIFLQILMTALAVNETQWAENFINKYKAKLLPDTRDSVECMAYAFLYFDMKEYRKVLDSLNKVEFIDVQDKIFMRVLTAKSYYELNDMETLLHYIDSSKNFLFNNPSVSEIQCIYNHNFYNFMRKLIFVKENKDKEDIHILKNEVEKNEEISHKSWLLEKLNELKDINK